MTGRGGPFDVQTSFFIPLWRRIATAGLCLGWGVFEMSMDNTLWGVLFGGIGVWLCYQFFIAFDPKDDP